MLPGSAVGADTSKVDMSVFPNLDIYRSANVLIREHGEEAEWRPSGLIRSLV